MTGLDALLSAVRRRERIADAARGITRWALPAGLFIAALALLAVRLRGAPSAVLWLTALPVPAILVWALLRPRSMRATARRIDAHYGLQDQIGSAYELRRSAPRGVAGDDPRTAEIIGLLDMRANELAAGLDPRPVIPLSVPSPRWLDAVAVASVLGAALVPRPAAPMMEQWSRQLDLPLQALATRAGLDLALADPLRHSLRDLTKDDEDVAAKAAQRMLEILEKLETGELERAEAFEELEQLEELLSDAEEKFEAQLEEDPGMLADALRELAEALQEHEITQEAGKAFEDSKPEEAEAELNEAAEEAASDEASDEAMRKAMEEAERRLKDAAEQSRDTGKKLDEAERRLRREQKKKKSDDPQEEERRLQREKDMKERVEELRRKHEREMAAQRRLEQLRRNAQDAAKKGQGGQKRKDAVQKLSRGASQGARTARQASRMRQARDALEEAKTFVRRAGKQGEGANRRRQQFKRFAKAAKGQKGQDGKDGKGKGNKGKTTLLIEGEVGDGPPKMLIQGDGQQGQDGQGQGQGQGQDGQGQDGQGGQQGQDGGQGLTPGGDGIGQGSVDPEGEDRSMQTNKKDVHVRAREGRGASRAEVIRQSSQEGFAGEAYRDVYVDYRSFAQSALDNEALPPAKRRTVQRYYQLIQPRE